ncbi:family 43 glycosylhydrolase [Paenibacillus mesotrionivorans]|uniref:Family 43 glycosylhydrolase n=1 Tax=Paenibacillus mesotrionivorans TaxID=3160968 RepID=A0ACC7P3D5_9BACL
MEFSNQQDVILVYTRQPDNDYTESLANSIHLALGQGGEQFQPLNRNYGILFAEATVDERSVIQEKGVQQPYLFQTAEGGFGLVAVRVDKTGAPDEESRGQLLLWKSTDLATFQSCGLLRLHPEAFVKEAVCEYNASEQIYEIRWRDETGKSYVNRLADLAAPDGISRAEGTAVADAGLTAAVEAPMAGILLGNMLSVDGKTLETVKAAWLPLHHTETRVPEQISASSVEQVKAVTATAIYSDGSSDEKQVDWDVSGVDFTRPGVYTVSGTVANRRFLFPLAEGYADPVILPWEGKYYFLATNDNMNDIGLYVREADTLEALFAPGFKEAVILDVDEERGFIQTFWAPEFHVIGGELYILFAVGGRQWGPQCHMMKLRKGGSIMEAADWQSPERVRRANGRFLAEDGITLDMTYFRSGETSYVAWSYRKGIGTSMDTGSMIYIASVEARNPVVLTSEPVLLTRPLLGWENIQGTINNEGPYPLVTEDTVYLAYSGGAARGYTYSVGLLSIPHGADCLEAANWTKAGTPVLSYYSLKGLYGAGHNSFFRDTDGTVYILYHGEERLVKHGVCSSAMHRVHFNKQDKPVFDVAGDRDVHPALTACTIQVVVQPQP